MTAAHLPAAAAESVGTVPTSPSPHGGVSPHDGPPAVGDEHTELVEAIARRVVELLRPSLAAVGTPPAQGFVTATELARVLGVTRDTVYAHADELGAVRLGGGDRPRLRFDAARAAAAWTARSAGARSQASDPGSATSIRRGRPRGGAATSGDLLPIRGRAA